MCAAFKECTAGTLRKGKVGFMQQKAKKLEQPTNRTPCVIRKRQNSRKVFNK